MRITNQPVSNKQTLGSVSAGELVHSHDFGYCLKVKAKVSCDLVNVIDGTYYGNVGINHMVEVFPNAVVYALPPTQS